MISQLFACTVEPGNSVMFSFVTAQYFLQLMKIFGMKLSVTVC